MSDFEIMTGVPLPPARRGQGRTSKYPFADMDQGDYFIVPNRSIKQMASVARLATKKYGVKFAVRSGPIETAGVPAGGVGIWHDGELKGK